MFILNEGMDDIIKIVKPLEDLGVLTDVITEAVKHETKKNQNGRSLAALLAPLATSVVQPVISLMVKGITRRGVMRAGKEYYNNTDKIF